ncbi:hypothetical protein RJJ37_24995 [Rhizobium redzepovicii]|uniref:PepSY domain-containing protein n=1 Tax=Rhizobium redzepovicii TaxID=2867518 RepID=A0AAW8P9F8_9HYPH|nr:hypothetical protein [Rhizobium redzepovicii]MDR9762844.1 hypothetical protein [Rhizobium redzepovicii]
MAETSIAVVKNQGTVNFLRANQERLLILAFFIWTPVSGPNIRYSGRMLAPSAELRAPRAPAAIVGAIRPGGTISEKHCRTRATRLHQQWGGEMPIDDNGFDIHDKLLTVVLDHDGKIVPI